MVGERAKIATAVFALATAACAGNAASERRVLGLEREIVDIRQSQQQLEKKLEELQIQLAVLRQSSGAAHRSGGKAVAGESSPSAAAKPLSVPEKTLVDDDLDEAQIVGLFQQAVDKARRGPFPAAFDELGQFISNFSDHALAGEALMMRGRAAFSAGELGRALEDFLAAVERYPNLKQNAEALLMAGRCCEMLGRLPDAKNHYLHLVQSFPLSTEAAEANRRLEAIR